MRQLKDKYSTRLAVFAFPVLAVIALFVVRTQTTKRAVVVEHADRSPEQISAVPAVVTTGGKEDMRPREGNAHPFCAPGSTVYLTQAQQEYKLGKRGHNTPDVKDAKKTEQRQRSRSAWWIRGVIPYRMPTSKSPFSTAAHTLSMAKPMKPGFSRRNICRGRMFISMLQKLDITTLNKITGSIARASPARKTADGFRGTPRWKLC